jgi:hypothetical protein
MTEGEWWDCNPTELGKMLTFLHGKRASPRKVWLFDCACCRGVWPLLTDQRSRAAVEAAERYADGLVAGETLEAAHRDAGDAIAEGGQIRALSVMANRVTLSEATGNRGRPPPPPSRPFWTPRGRSNASGSPRS